MYPRSETLPCLVCGKALMQAMGGYPQPDGGVECTTTGNYGSTVFDPMDGERLRFNLCDACLTAAGEAGRVASGHPVQRVTFVGEDGEEWLVGVRRMDDPDDVPWNPSLPPRDMHPVRLDEAELLAPPPWVELTVGEAEIGMMLRRS